MTPTPFTMSDPVAPAGYSWEATSEQVAARYGIAVDRVVRFDLNTSPTPPDLAARILASGEFETSLSEYPPSDYRRLTEAAARRYGVPIEEILVGAGADEVLDIVAKTFLPAGGAAILPTPSYAMYRVLTEQRAARLIAIPRQGPDAGYAIDVARIRAAAPEADLIWLCSPNNPTGLPEPDGTIAALLAAILDDASADGRTAPVVVLDEAYAEFTGSSLHPLRAGYPRLIVVRTLSKAYALAGLRVGFALAARPAVAAMEPYRPPGSVSTVSVTVATHALEDDAIVREAVERVASERDRLTSALGRIGWHPGPSRTNFLLVAFDSAERAAEVADGLLRRGLVPRTFPATHPLADHLRLTVRSIDEDDRLIGAAAEIEAEGKEPAP